MLVITLLLMLFEAFDGLLANLGVELESGEAIGHLSQSFCCAFHLIFSTMLLCDVECWFESLRGSCRITSGQLPSHFGAAVESLRDSCRINSGQLSNHCGMAPL